MATHSQVPASLAGESKTLPIMALLAGWLIPGAGHLFVRKPIRAALIFVSITSMFFIGIGLQGKIYQPNTGDLLDMLNFAGDLGAGLLYLLARLLEWGHASRRGPAEHHGRSRCTFAGEREEASVSLSHFSAVLLFSLFTSVVFGITQRSEPKAMIRFGAYCFAMFVGGVIVASWLMYFIKH